MLKSLNIENIAVIEKADIEFTQGLNVLTGETGAGKSIVVDSINAILGERTSKDLVRTGADYAFVSAVFDDVDSSIGNKLSELCLTPDDDGTLIVSRRISSAGKSTCRINGCPCTAAMLREVGALLVNIHGQHDSQSLLNSDYHYKFIDMLSRERDIYDKYKTSFKTFLSVRKRLKELTADADSRDRQLELLDYQINEITQADIKHGEIDELKKRKNIILNSQKIADSLNAVLSAISGDDENNGAGNLLSTALRELNDVKDVDGELSKIYDTVDGILDSVETVKDMLELKLDTTDYSPDELNKIEERLDLLYDFKGKYGDTEEDMLAFLEKSIAQRDTLVSSDEEIEKLSLEYDRVYTATIELADKLSQNRKAVARELESKVKAELEYLDMPKIKFIVDFAKGNLSSNGYDKIEFLISTNPGEPPKPLSKIASGGELSRIMLAIKNIIASSDSIDTLIFDEIDTGVSGRASRKIGLKLKSVSKHTQVICVTHSAQIASVSDNHLLIQKSFENDRTFTSVKSLDFDGRKYELARIMGGLEITDSLLKSAEELLGEN